MIWTDGEVETDNMQEGRGESGKAGGVYCFCTANSESCHVFISLSPTAFLPSFSPPNFSRLPAFQLEDMIAFPC